MEQFREKQDYYYYFEVDQEMYEAIKALPWVESAKPRGTPKEGIESLKVFGKQYKIAYANKDGTYVVREAYRFLCEGLVGLKRHCEAGGYLVEKRDEHRE